MKETLNRIIITLLNKMSLALMIVSIIGIWGKYVPGTSPLIQMVGDLIFLSLFILGAIVFILTPS